VRSRTDGSERLQLTFPPMRAFSPQWSPDGSQIAVQAEPQMGARSKIYLIQNSGGAPVMAAPESQDRQTYPSWTADGEAIIFSGSEANDSSPALYRLDLKAKHASLLPGSSNLYWGQISPDGHYVAALEDSNQRLMLYDTVAHSTRTLAELADYPCWSADGRYVYFSTLFFAGHGGTGGVFRWNVSTNTTEMVIRAPDFPLTGIWGVHYSLTPDGAVLLLRDAAKRDLYALDMELP
jgi:Tol biopolymer transport system component